MAKATVDNLRAEGWRKDQFGGDFALTSAFDDYLTSLLAEAGNWAAYRIGQPVYAALVIDYLIDCVRRAELAYCAYRLWTRRASYSDSQAVGAFQDGQYLERREYLAHSTAAMAVAEAALAEVMRALGIDPAEQLGVPAFAIGHIETGPFTLHSETSISV